MTSVPKHAPHARRTPFVVLVLGLIVGGMFALLTLNTAAAANEVGRHDLAGQDQSVAAQLVELQNEARASAAPANLAAAAAALGMVPGGNPAYLMIGTDGKVRLLGSAAPVSGVPTVVPSPTKSKVPAAKPATSTKAKPAKSTKKQRSKSPSSRTTSAAKSASPSKGKHSTSPTKPSAAKVTPTPSPTPTPTLTLGGTR